MSISNFLTTEELSALIKYDVRTIRERLKDSVLIEGVHYIRPFGGRKILYLQDAILRDMQHSAKVASNAFQTKVPLANGGHMYV